MGFRPITPDELADSPVSNSAPLSGIGNGGPTFIGGKTFRPITSDELDLSTSPSMLERGAKGLIGGVSSAIPFNMGDEILAGISSPFVSAKRLFQGGDPSLSGSYNDALETVRSSQDLTKQEAPITSGIASLAGNLAVPVPTKIFSTAKGAIPAIGNIAKGAGLGATYGGVSGFGGGEGEDSRIEGLKSGGKIGAVTGGVTSAIGEGIAGIFRNAPEMAGGLRRKAIGARQSDYQKNAENLRFFQEGDDVASQTKTALDDLLSNGKLGKSTDPSKMIVEANKAESTLAEQIGKVVKNYDTEVAKPVYPKFERAMEMLTSGKVPTDKVDSYLTRLQQVQSGIVSNGKGKLSYLQQQKQAFGKLYDQNDSSLNEFNRAIYHDLQETIEGAVPSIKGLNKELQKYQIVQPILKRGQSAKENKTAQDAITDAVKTTGGYGSLGIVGSVLGSAPGAALGLATAGGLQYLRSPSGRNNLANAIEGAPNFAKSLSSTGVKLPSFLAPQSSLLAPERSSFDVQPKETLSAYKEQPKVVGNLSNPLSKNTPDQPTTQDPFNTSLNIQKLTRAVMNVESGGNPKAISNKGAIGLMQLMPATAKDLGVDPYDPVQNVQGGMKYLSSLLQQFPQDPRLAIASYNAGQGRISRLLAKNNGLTYEDIDQDLPKETRDYVPKVLKQLAKEYA